MYALVVLVVATAIITSLANTQPFQSKYLNLSHLNPRSKYAIMIMGCRSIDFKHGLVLFHTVIKQHTNCDLIFLYFNDPSHKYPYYKLHDEWAHKFNQINVTIVNVSSPLSTTDVTKSYSKFLNNLEWHYIKLFPWQFTMYEKILFLDADMLIMKDINHMFLMDADFIYSNGSGSPYNAGMTIIKPNLSMYNDMITRIRKGNYSEKYGWEGTGFVPSLLNGGPFYGASTNQGFLWYYFIKRSSSKYTVLKLKRSIYNYQVPELDGNDINAIIFFHFTACFKPGTMMKLHNMQKRYKSETAHKVCTYYHNLWTEYYNSIKIHGKIIS